VRIDVMEFFIVFGILFILAIIIWLVICIKDFFVKEDIRVDSERSKEFWEEHDRREKLGYRDEWDDD
jgi:hypothetical protein